MIQPAAEDRAALVAAPTRRPFSRGDWLASLSIVILVTVIWCAAYNRWTAAAWETPILYGSDAWWGLAAAKTMASGEIIPFLPKQPRSFGAPFIASWNDYPTVEESLSGWWALLAWIFGVFTGSNIAVLAGQMFAALAFYWVCRRLRYRWEFSIAGALLFSFSRYGMVRGLMHLPLTYYWHLPLGLLVIWGCVAKTPPIRSRWKLWFSMAVAVLFGIQNPYYAGIFVQFLVGASLWQFARREPWPSIVAPLFLVGVTAAAFGLMNLDTLYWKLANGSNTAAVARSYQGVELYALKPIDLLMPGGHRFAPLETWANNAYFSQTLYRGEAGSPYLGVIAIAALGWMLWRTFAGVARGNLREVPPHIWLIAWVVIYSIVGGVNGIVGFAFQLFRASDRYSIVILAAVLLFLVRELTRHTRRWRTPGRVAVAGCICGIGLLDQIPRSPSGAAIAATARVIAADRAAAQALERRLPPGAMVFQMPVADFPEVPPIEQMNDYEHFRPYLHSRSLRYSYGSHKGRPRDEWQKDAERLGPPYLVQMLEAYGFAAVWINRNGYADGGAALLERFRGAGRADLLVETPEFFSVRLNPAASPGLPPVFDTGWFGLERAGEQTWRWCSGNADVVVHNPGLATKNARVSFAVGTLKARRVTLSRGDKKLFECAADPRELYAADDVLVELAPGENRLRFETDVPSERPPNGDLRKLSFSLHNFSITY